MKGEESRHQMGLLSCIATIVGACVGSAIFSMSGITIYFAGASSMISWLVAALIYMAYGMLLAELAVRYPHSGGIFIFPKRAIGGASGRFWGFISGWGYIISNIIAIGFSAIYVGAYLRAGFPELFGEGSELYISLGSMLFSLAILLWGGKRSQIVQNTLVLFLLLTLCMFCVFAFFGRQFQPSHFQQFFTTGVYGATGFISAIPIALVAYGGCVVIPFMTSEVSKPQRNIPRSLFIGLGIVALLYIAVIASIVGTLPFSVISSDVSLRYIPLHASISHGTLACYGWLARLVSVCGVIALLTTIIALMRVNARSMQAIALEGYLPNGVACENSRAVPGIALIVMAVIAMLMCFFPQWTAQMIQLGAVLNIVSMTITCTSHYISHRARPSQSGFTAPIGIFLPIIVVVIFLACYIPDILSGGNALWTFTGIVYAVALVTYVCCRSKVSRRLGGIVVHGKGHGSRHGMPTANLQPFDNKQLPTYGVWAVRVFVAGKVYRGITHVGTRPSDDDLPHPTVETLILDFDGDLYGRFMCIEFLRYIRPTQTFRNLDELRVQIERDKALAAR